MRLRKGGRGSREGDRWNIDEGDDDHEYERGGRDRKVGQRGM